MKPYDVAPPRIISRRLKRKRRPRNYVPEVPPSRRKLAWATILIRSEHYAMLRQLSEKWQLSLGNVAMQLIQIEYLRTLAEVDPETAQRLQEEYDERFGNSFNHDND